MQSQENKPTSSTKRLGDPLNVNSGYKWREKRTSPPQTPATAQTSKSNIPAGNRALKVRMSPRETFLEDITPVDPPVSKKDNDPERGAANRDSHDLSLSPRRMNRDSLVDHMLLSLDQFCFGPENEAFGRQSDAEGEQLCSTFGDEESYPSNHNFAAPRNPRGGHTYSYSSDYDNIDDSSRFSDKMSRRRRSNSSSNFQSGLGRMNSIRNDTVPNSIFARSPPTTIPSRGIHSRSGKGSKGSSANSFDLGYTHVASNQRWTHGLAGRSSSFDYGSDRQSRKSNTMAPQINTVITAFDQYDYDAAPTPTVPGGPRRVRPTSPIIIPQPEPVQVEHTPKKLERKRSTRSSKSVYKEKSFNALSGSRLDYGLDDQSRELPPLPAFMKDRSAPAPLVGYGKTKDQATSGAAQLSKDRLGFFRRVFGSSRNNTGTTTEPPPSHSSTTSAENADHPSTKPNHIATQIKSQYLPLPREPPPPPKESTHVLTKKPSSFFRRRKKSISESDAHVPLPIVPPMRLQAENENIAPLASPVSSLRKVMNPYLKGPGKSPLDTQQNINYEVMESPEDKRHMRGFSPDYEPDKSATIRAIKPSSRGTGDSIPIAYVPVQPTLTRSPNTGIPIDLDGQWGEQRDATFLQDSSDNDPDAHSTASTSAPSKDTSGTPWLSSSKPPSSPAVARDMALVAEYERVHSRRSPTPAKLDVARCSSAVDSGSDSTSFQTKPTSATKEGEWVILTPSKSRSQVEKESRVWLEPSSSEEDVTLATLALPKKANNVSTRTSGSTDTVYKSATSLPIVQIEEEDDSEPADHRISIADEVTKSLDEIPQDNALSIENDRDRAKKIYDGNEDFIQKDKAAAWMGEEDPARSRTLFAYMELYDFSNWNILAALRNLCGRLALKAESQQVDRILDAFAKRWCQCNPNHGFKITDVVHTICYSILLLNTDLYLADIDQKMTRSQFVKNTMPTIRSSVVKSAPDAFEPNRPSVLPGKSQAFVQDANQSTASLKPERSSIEGERPSWRSSFRLPARADTETLAGNAPTPLNYDTPTDDCGPLVKAPFHGTFRTWEVQIEIVLKDFYNSIRNERLPLFGAPVEKAQLQVPSSSTLSAFANGMLRRTPSVLSKAPSESLSYARGRTAETVRVGNGKFANKNRSRPRLYPNSGLGSSRTSLDDQSSMWSPSVSSSTWSKYSLGKTQTSMSVDSLGSSWPQGDYQQSIGFANALSQAIIREEAIGSIGSGSDEFRVAPLLEDELLELAGAPWAKEGIVKHKHHLESLDKKARDRNWNEVFAVIEKGYMSLFSFSTKSMRNKSKGKAARGVVGGGNWQENAENLGSFLLRQTIASALPSPGYSKARPHVWALSLPTGAVHLFQVGTPDIVKEFVSTANYWSARLSNHPLVGGISNIEYGWSDAIVNNALVTAINDSTSSSRPSTSGARPSMHSSLRSSLDQGYGSGHMKSRLPGDRVTISDWTPPTQSMRASNLLEQDQLKTLLAYVAGIEEDLQKHNQLRSPMLLAFTPRHPNAQRAMVNWEKKSSYLLREIVKFRTYIDCLETAKSGRQRIYAERTARKEELENEDEVDATLGPAEL